MSRHRVELTPDWPPGNGSVKVDGHEIGPAVQRFALTAHAGEVPTLEVELSHAEVTSLGAEQVEVIITEPTHEALIALGWTPPPED